MRKIIVFVTVFILLLFFYKQIKSKNSPLPITPQSISSSSPSIPAPEIFTGDNWYNSSPLTIASLKGKVVLVNFFRYSSIASQKTIPYLINWSNKYRDDGLVIIGIHSPEFEFEKEPEYLSRAIKDLGISYPIVEDNNFKNWDAFGNHHWPAKYIVNQQGNIVYKYGGLGGFNEAEKVIQSLLGVTKNIDQNDIVDYPETKEVYLANLKKWPNPDISLTGNWTYTPESSKPKPNSKLTYSFKAKNVYLVAKPQDTNKNSSINVYIDGKLSKTVNIPAGKLYEVISGLDNTAAHKLTLEFTDNNTEVYELSFEYPIK